MAQIDPVNLLFYSAALLCVSNAIACHCVAWHVYNINRRYKVGAIVGIYMAFASIFGAAVACIYYGFYPALGHCLVVVATVIGSLRIWNMVLENRMNQPTQYNYDQDLQPNLSPDMPHLKGVRVKVKGQREEKRKVVRFQAEEDEEENLPGFRSGQRHLNE